MDAQAAAWRDHPASCLLTCTSTWRAKRKHSGEIDTSRSATSQTTVLPAHPLARTDPSAWSRTATQGHESSSRRGDRISRRRRSTPLSWEDCKTIEATRAQVMRRRGLCPSEPRILLFADHEAGGLAHEHAYQYAAASLMDAVDRALSGKDGDPPRQAVASQIASTCWRLGCRTNPLECGIRHTYSTTGPFARVCPCAVSATYFGIGATSAAAHAA